MQMESLCVIPNEYEVVERTAKVMKNAQEEVQGQTTVVSNTQVQKHIYEIAREQNNDNDWVL
jgi:hypothetical protein